MSQRKSCSQIEMLEDRRMMSVYYVSTTGNDTTNTGTLSLPFASLKKAFSVANPGDQVQMRGGTYKPTISQGLIRQGTAAAHIVVKPYGSEKPIIDGTNLASGDLVVVFGAAYVDITGITIQNSPNHGLQMVAANHITLTNNSIINNGANGISMSGSSYTDVLVQNNIVTGNSRTRTLFSGIAIGQGSKIIVRGNTINTNKGCGVDMWKVGAGCIIEKNTLHDNKGADIYLRNASGVEVRSNFSYSLHLTDYYFSSRPSVAIQIGAEGAATEPPSSNNKIYNNISVGSGWGILYSRFGRGGGLLNTTITNNVFVNPVSGAFGIDPGPHSGTLIANNISYKTIAGGVMTNQWTNTQYPTLGSITWKSNVWYGKAPQAFVKSATDIYTDPQFLNVGSFNPLDYRLKLTSPAINKGTLISWLKTDYSGTVRPKGVALDIGAFEMA